MQKKVQILFKVSKISREKVENVRGNHHFGWIFTNLFFWPAKAAVELIKLYQKHCDFLLFLFSTLFETTLFKWWLKGCFGNPPRADVKHSAHSILFLISDVCFSNSRRQTGCYWIMHVEAVHIVHTIHRHSIRFRRYKTFILLENSAKYLHGFIQSEHRIRIFVVQNGENKM